MAFVTLDILPHNIAKVRSLQSAIQGTLVFFKSLPWLVIKIHVSKLSHYCNIFLSFRRYTMYENI